MQKAAPRKGVLPQLCEKLLEVAGETACYRDTSQNCRLVVLLVPKCTTPFQMHHFQWFLWGKPPVRGDTTPRHEPGTGREQSRNTPLGG